MKRITIAGVSAALLVTMCTGPALADDVSTKKLQIKDHADPAKRQVQVFSKDAGVLYTDANNPGTDGMSIAVYSATDDLCIVLPGGPEWTEKAGKSWKYKNKVTKNQAQIADGKLQVKIRSGVSFTLADDFPQDAVNVKVQFGNLGESFCMRCAAPLSKDDAKKFLGKDCIAAACDVEPALCDPTVTTTTTTSTTTTTLPALPGTILKAVLSQGTGNFNYGMAEGTVGADQECNTVFPGSHACLYSELVNAEAAGDLDNITDVDDDVVTAFWAIDPLRPGSAQCMQDATMPASTRWRYSTAHQDVGGDFVTLTNATGVLSALQPGGPPSGGPKNCTGMGGQKWVGCCQ
ncbi:MAG: hypothetical protein ABR587_13410 [Candidatus Binatia bacterium]